MSPIVPNWHDLKIFLEVARCGTLGAAARRLKVDPSTLSRHISRLEETINAPIFERTNQGLHLTAGGHGLLEYVESMEASALALTEQLGDRPKEPSGTVRVGSMEGIASLYLAAEFQGFSALHPKIAIELVTTTQQMHVNRREADVFLSFFPMAGKSIDVVPLGSFPLHLYASPEYLSRHGHPCDLGDLPDHQFASYVDDLIQLDTVRWLNEIIPRPKLAFQSSSMIAQMFAAAAGAGIVMLPSFAKPERLGMIRLLNEHVSVRRTIWMTVHRDLQYLPRIKAVTRFLEKTIGRDYPCQTDQTQPHSLI